MPVTVWLPVELGVYWVEQLAVFPAPERMHVEEENLPEPTLVNVTAPEGVRGVPGLVSVRVIVHVMGERSL